MERIDVSTWERREIYETFSKCGWPFYAVTIPVDVTNVKAFAKAKGLSFYHLMVWLVTKAVNAVPALRVRIRGGEVVRLDVTHPSFTSMRPGSEAFQIITIPWEPDMDAFCARARERCDSQQSFIEQQMETDELIYISCTPWFDFTSLTNEHDLNRDDAIPRVAWGKYYEDAGRLWVHLSIEVNHRTVDGFHLGQFKAALDRAIEALAPEGK